MSNISLPHCVVFLCCLFYLMMMIIIFLSGLIGYSKYIIAILNPSSSVEPWREVSFKKKKINYIYHGLVMLANEYHTPFPFPVLR